MLERVKFRRFQGVYPIMTKYIVGVDYRHNLPVAYLSVVGKRPALAEKQAKKVNAFLIQELGEEVRVLPPRYKGYDLRWGQDRYETPIFIQGDAHLKVKALLSRLVLQGHLDTDEVKTSAA